MWMRSGRCHQNLRRMNISTNKNTVSKCTHIQWIWLLNSSIQFWMTVVDCPTNKATSKFICGRKLYGNHGNLRHIYPLPNPSSVFSSPHFLDFEFLSWSHTKTNKKQIYNDDYYYSSIVCFNISMDALVVNTYFFLNFNSNIQFNRYLFSCYQWICTCVMFVRTIF